MRRVLLLCFFMTVFFLGCTIPETVVKENNSLEQVIVPEQEVIEHIYSVQNFGNKIYGSSYAILAFEMHTSDENYVDQNMDVLLVDAINQNKISAQSTRLDGKHYVVFENLSENTKYDVVISGMVNNETQTLSEDFQLITPKRSIPLSKVDTYIEDEIDRVQTNETDRLLLETQACLSLLGFESGEIGSFEGITQANITIFEYSVNKMDGFVNYENIFAVPNEKTLNLMKDILSCDIYTTCVDIVQDFDPDEYELSEYAIIDVAGGKLDIESYILDEISTNDVMKEIYKQYPFDVNTPEFQTLYEEDYQKNISKERLDVWMLQKAAKNKALFSKEAMEYLIDLAQPRERLVEIATSDNTITLNTMIAYSYMYLDAYRHTGKCFVTSTTYRDYDFQWELYSQKLGIIVAKSRNASWHYERQKLSYVPGFSNHQYGVAIDFFERTIFEDDVLYEYLNTNAQKYGFYNYYIEPWHWVYLGNIH